MSYCEGTARVLQQQYRAAACRVWWLRSLRRPPTTPRSCLACCIAVAEPRAGRRHPSLAPSPAASTPRGCRDNSLQAWQLARCARCARCAARLAAYMCPPRKRGPPCRSEPVQDSFCVMPSYLRQGELGNTQATVGGAGQDERGAAAAAAALSARSCARAQGSRRAIASGMRCSLAPLSCPSRLTSPHPAGAAQRGMGTWEQGRGGVYEQQRAAKSAQLTHGQGET